MTFVNSRQTESRTNHWHQNGDFKRSTYPGVPLNTSFRALFQFVPLTLFQCSLIFRRRLNVPMLQIVGYVAPQPAYETVTF